MHMTIAIENESHPQ
jgi:1,2-phenylacetyl-CoA epoxidase catalytic subunit